MKWEFESSAQADVSRDRVWSIWIDVAGWPRWNPGVGLVLLDGPVIEGATGTIRAKGGPATAFKIRTVEPGRCLITESSERLIQLSFEQELADGDDGSVLITHRVRMTGLGTPVLRHTVGARLRCSIPTALEALAKLATAEQLPET